MKTQIDLKVGDFVTSYYKGYFEIVKIVRRWKNKNKSTEFEKQAYCIMGEQTEDCGEEMNSLVHLKQLFDSNGKAIKTKKLKVCDAGFCRPAFDVIDAEIIKHNQLIKQLRELKGEDTRFVVNDAIIKFRHDLIDQCCSDSYYIGVGSSVMTAEKQKVLNDILIKYNVHFATNGYELG